MPSAPKSWMQGLTSLSLYDALLTIALAAGWMLPNHYVPWRAFQSNAWVAAILLLLASRVLWTLSGAVRVSTAGCFLLALPLIPCLQFGFGLLPLPSDALMEALYLLGLATAFIVGEHWNRSRPGQPAAMILVGTTIAAVVSVGMATYQWLGLSQDNGLMDIWVLYFAGDGRPYANLAQPNQLASLLLWGLLGVAWARHKRWIGVAVTLLLAALIIFGIALTASRTALLTLTCGVAFVSIRRLKFLDRRAVWAVQGLYVFYLVCLLGHAQLGRMIGLDTSLTMLARTHGELRFALWAMALDATTASPWLGFGWGRSVEGFFQVFLRHPEFGDVFFDQSHNLILDLLLWVGWPLGLVLLLSVALWLRRVVLSVAGTEQLLVVAALVVMLVHAMLEFPLHYGYFLWPFGMLAGAANAANPSPAMLTLPRKMMLALLAGLFLVLLVIVRDYLRIEASFTELRFQIALVGRNHDQTPPKTVLLTDWPKVIVMSRATPHAGMSAAEIQEWQDLFSYNPSPLAFRKIIGALILNGRPEEAKIWAARSCWLLRKELCAHLIDEWHVPMQAPAQTPAHSAGQGE